MNLCVDLFLNVFGELAAEKFCAKISQTFKNVQLFRHSVFGLEPDVFPQIAYISVKGNVINLISSLEVVCGLIPVEHVNKEDALILFNLIAVLVVFACGQELLVFNLPARVKQIR